MRAKVPLLVLLLAACGKDAPPAAAPDPRIAEAAPLVARTAPEADPRDRRLACVALGRLGGPAARDRLLELLTETTRDPAQDGPTHLYAAAGLTLLKDPGTAIDLLENLSTVNPNDSLAVLASEERNGEYYPIDAQICEALLAMGLWNVEEELVRQLRRKDKIRVLIDAHAVLRRQTGLALPFRYNGSYADRNADADRWLAELRRTRAERAEKRPFDASSPRFRERCAEVVSWLGGQNVRLRLKAHKILPMVGASAVPFVVEALRSDHRVAQRQAAYTLGLMGATEAKDALRDALAHEDAEARAQAIDALRAIGDAGAPVRPLLSDEDPAVRAAAAAFLGALGDADDVPRLRERLRGETAPSTRTRILEALLDRGDRSAATDLVEVFVSGEQLDREAALAALERAAGKKAAVDALASEEERRRAAEDITGWFRQ